MFTFLHKRILSQRIFFIAVKLKYLFILAIN